MKNLLKWPQIILISTISFHAYGSETIVIDKIMYTVEVEKDSLGSSECLKSPDSCFAFPKKMVFKGSQSPLFSLCYQSGGRPQFFQYKEEKHKRTLCLKEGKVLDLESLMIGYKSQK